MKTFQVAIVGINSLFGGTSALLLKQSPFVKCLKLYDPRNVEAALDVSIINTKCKVKTYRGEDQLENAFQEADIIVISDEAQELLDMDSHLMKVSNKFGNYAKAIARASPNAIVVVASTPVNCLLPMMSQLLAKNGCYDHNKVLGTTTVDTVRASALLASRLRLDPREVVLPVIGGSSENSRVPVFSQARPFFSIKPDIKSSLITEIRRGDSIVLANKGSPEVLNRAHSTVRFLNSIMSGLNGQSNATDITLCRTDLVPGVEYFSLPVVFGKEGIVKRFGVPKTTPAEDEMIDEAIKQVKKDSDRAAFIVRRALELPEYNKYTSLSDRSSSQKEIFDLYVKCLPKPENDAQSTGSGHKSNPNDYSFRTLIDTESEPVADPFDIPENKSFQNMVRNKLKNVSSEESLLKSTGFYNSPLQRPIVILEPLNCPSQPSETPRDSNLDNIFDEVGKCVLHEKNLAESSQFEVKGNTVGETQKKHFPADPNPVPPKMAVDPIAKFKAHISKPLAAGEEKPHKAPVASKLKTMSKFNKLERSRETLSTCNKRTVVEPVKSEKYESIIGSENRSHPKVLLPMQEPPLKKESIPGKSSSSRLYRPSEGHIANKKHHSCLEAEDVFEDAEEDLDIFQRYRNGPKFEKFETPMTLLDKADSLAEVFLSPKKTYYTESSNSHNRRTHFRETAVKSMGRNNISNRVIPFKSPFKANVSDNSLYNAETGENQYAIQFCKPRKPPPKSKPIQSRKRKVTEKDQNDPNSDGKNEVVVHVVCPKCQNELTCQNGKKVASKNEDEINTTALEQKIKQRSCDECEKEQGRVLVDSRISQTARPTKPNNASSERQKDQRLKKLKEKINQKLIPLLNSQLSNSSKIKFRLDSTSTDNQANSTKKTEERFAGTPLVLTCKVDNEGKFKDEGQPSSDRKWQGVPFVIKGESEELPRNCKDERHKSLLSTMGSKNSTTLKEKHLFKVPFSETDPKENEVLQKDEMAIVRNKLQLLVSKANLKIKKVPEKLQRASEPLSHPVKTRKITRRMGASDLGHDNVRNYMLAKTKEPTDIKTMDVKTGNNLVKRESGDKKLVSELSSEKDASTVQEQSSEPLELRESTKILTGRCKDTCTNEADKLDSTTPPSTKNKQECSSQVKTPEEKKATTTTEEHQDHQSSTPIKTLDVTETKSQRAEEPEAKTKEHVKEAHGGGQIKTGDLPDRNATVEDKSVRPNKKIEAESTMAERLKPHSRKKNKLQLLAELRRYETKRPPTVRCKLHSKNGVATEKTKRGSVPVTDPIVGGDQARISAAVKLAQRRSTLKKMERVKMKSRAIEKPINILEGLAFPPKKAQKAKVHPRSLLKELSSAAERRKSAAKPEEPKPKSTLIFKKRSVDPSRGLNFSKTLEPHRSQKFSRMFPTGGRNSEYTREEEEFARLASEFISKRELRIPKISNTQNNFRLAVTAPKPCKTHPKRLCGTHVAKSTKRGPRHPSTWLKTSAEGVRTPRPTNSISNKLMSMPHIRHQPEHFESSLGSVEVRPGLTKFSSGKLYNGSCFSPDNSVESVLFNEYHRTNLLPSLRDVKETFYLEERDER